LKASKMNSSSVTIPENVPILVVDDEASIAKMISRALSQIGFSAPAFFLQPFLPECL